MTSHYCFGKVGVDGISGRIHVPLAVSCKLRCGYCSYSNNGNILCDSLPGASNLSLSTHEDISNWLQDKVKKNPDVRIIGVAGPGDPLLNPIQLEMFFEIINQHYCDYTVCLCSSGLNFKEIEPLLIGQKTLKYITFTINSINPKTINKIYFPSKMQFNAELFIEEQNYAVNRCIENNIKVKVNSVYLPTINDDEIYHLYDFYSKLGVNIFNLIPYQRNNGHLFAKLPPINYVKYKDLIAKLEFAGIDVLQKCYKCRADECGIFKNNGDCK